METITNDIIKQATEIGGDNLEKLFELFFRVHTGYDGSWELETWTDGGVNMIFYLDTSDKVSEFSSIVNNFDVDEEIDLHREDKRYQKAFTISESVEDFEGFKDWLFEVLGIIETVVYTPECVLWPQEPQKFKAKILLGAGVVRYFEEYDQIPDKDTVSYLDGTVKEVEYNTQAELNAYMDAVNDCDGWHRAVIAE